MRVTNGSAVSTASTAPDFSASLIVGNVTSTKFTLFGVDALLDQPLAEEHVQEGADAGRADLLADEVLGGVLDRDAVARDGRDRSVGDRVHDRSAGDRHEIEPAVDRLQEHCRGRAADLDRVRDDRRGNVGVDADQRHVGVEAVLGENALVARDHRRGAVAGRGAGDLELERIGVGGSGGRQGERGGRRQEPHSTRKSHHFLLPRASSQRLLIIDKK